MRWRLTKTIRKLPLAAAALVPLVAISCDSPSTTPQRHAQTAVSRKAKPSDLTNRADASVAHRASQIRVTVRGAVRKPGIYTLDRQANTAQAIVAAGGLTEQGALDSMNLTTVLRDKMTVIVPSVSSAGTKLSAPKAVTAVPSGAVPVATSTPPPSVISVVVKGAVVRPGTYRLLPGELTASALVAAGGPLPSADLGGIGLNQPVQNGMTVTVPARKSAMSAISPTAQTPSTAPKTAQTATVDINTATVDQLQRLPGIGLALATRILDYRKEVGAFRTPEQLMDVKGITEEKFRLIQSLVRTN